MDERIRRTLHEVAILIQDMAEEDLKLLEEIQQVRGRDGEAMRSRTRSKLNAIRDSASRIRKETRR